MSDIHTTPEASPKNELVDTATLTERLRNYIEMQGAKRAYAAELGASEWEAFLTDEDQSALAALSSLETRLEEATRRCEEERQFRIRESRRADHLDTQFTGLSESLWKQSQKVVAAKAREKALSDTLAEAKHTFGYLVGFLSVEGAMNDEQRQAALAKARQALVGVRGEQKGPLTNWGDGSEIRRSGGDA